jgi:hypothetical protein
VANEEGKNICPTNYLKYPYTILNVMICKIYGEDTSTHFIMEWFPMAYTMGKTRKDFK